MKYGQATRMIAARTGPGGRNRTAAIIAVAGVMCTVTVMLLTVSITSGFKDEITRRLQGFMPQVSVTAPYSYADAHQLDYLRMTPETEQALRETFAGARVWTAMRRPGILKTDDDYAPLIFTGYGAGRDTSFEASNMTSGVLPDFTKAESAGSIVIADNIARRLGLKTGDRVMSCFFVDDMIRARKLTIAGTFASNFADYDNTICYASPEMLRTLAGVDSLTVTSIEADGIAPDDVADGAARLQETYLRQAQASGAGEVPVVDNITHTGALYLNWLELLDTNVTVIFVLMCCVAACTLVSSLFILILNNVSTIGILRAMGMPNNEVSRIFVLLTIRLVGIGMIFGNIFALTFMWLQATFHLIPLNPGMYYLSHVPVSIDIFDILMVNLGTIVFAWLVVILPARLTGRISPARTMRYD